MRGLDFTSWQSLPTTLLAIALVTLIGVGFRMLAMSTMQQRRERANRQINERLRVLIAAYKTLGGSFTGDLTVDPTHLRDLRQRAAQPPAPDAEGGGIPAEALLGASDRSRRMRDAVEAALSDIILLGTEEQVRMAGNAARQLVAGRQVHTHELVISLRNFIRKALDLEPVPAGLDIPMQGPARPGGSGSGERGKAKSGAEGEQRNRGSRSGGQSGGAMGMGVGMGMGGMGLSSRTAEDQAAEDTQTKEQSA